MGALAFLLMATIKGLPLIPPKCWKEPLMPRQVNLGFHGLARSPDLARFLKPFGVHDGTGAGYGSAHGVR